MSYSLGEWAIVNSELIHYSRNDAVYYGQKMILPGKVLSVEKGK